MCLTVPGLVIAIEGDEAIVLCAGRRRRASARFEPGLAVGDHVLIGLGSVLSRIEPEEAQRLAADLAAVSADPAADGGAWTGAEPKGA